jgi:deazaflavin-dependent oxidoreductase (nitroreductase family)
MAYLKPNPLAAKVFNRFAMATGMGGTQTLVVTGRKSGQEQRVPFFPVDVDGVTYLVSARGETQWVRNVRATPQVTLHTKAGARTCQAVEVPLQERSAVIAAYRRKAGRTVEGYWKKLPDDADHPVFALT